MLVCLWNGSSVCGFYFSGSNVCPAVFILHSWTCGIQPEGKLLLQIKIKQWWISGQYWRPLMVLFLRMGGEKAFNLTCLGGGAILFLPFFWLFRTCVQNPTVGNQPFVKSQKVLTATPPCWQQQSQRNVCSRCRDWQTRCFLVYLLVFFFFKLGLGRITNFSGGDE